ncbi:hypothetical protein ACWYXF_17005, partial [Lactiplantibacillus plantarum]
AATLVVFELEGAVLSAAALDGFVDSELAAATLVVFELEGAVLSAAALDGFVDSELDDTVSVVFVSDARAVTVPLEMVIILVVPANNNIAANHFSFFCKY